VESSSSEKHSMDNTCNDFKTAIENLNEEEKFALMALMWTGRGTYNPDKFEKAMIDAQSANNHH
tara:strand:+ start:428 stop:619 length:192 start_codon:yes stop_codon:yes gene_type:complete